MDNLPIRKMQDMVRGGKIIAVDVGKGQNMASAYSYVNSVSGWRVLWSYLNPFQKTLTVPNIMETITRTSMLASQAGSKDMHSLADVVLRPDISETGLFDIEAIDMLYERGYADSHDILKKWQKELSEEFKL